MLSEVLILTSTCLGWGSDFIDEFREGLKLGRYILDWMTTLEGLKQISGFC